LKILGICNTWDFYHDGPEGYHKGHNALLAQMAVAIATKSLRHKTVIDPDPIFVIHYSVFDVRCYFDIRLHRISNTQHLPKGCLWKNSEDSNVLSNDINLFLIFFSPLIRNHALPVHPEAKIIVVSFRINIGDHVKRNIFFLFFHGFHIGGHLKWQ
jgi:hypothetical protein